MNSLDSIAKSIKSLLDGVKIPTPTLPPVILSMATIRRPGLSATEIASRIIERQTEAGAPIGPAADGTQNISEAMERIRVEEIINAIKLNTRVEVSIPIGGIQFIGTGTNLGGPMVVKGFNTNFVEGDGIIS